MGFFLNRFFLYILIQSVYPYTEMYGSEKIHILAYFTELVFQVQSKNYSKIKFSIVSLVNVNYAGENENWFAFNNETLDGKLHFIRTTKRGSTVICKRRCFVLVLILALLATWRRI